MNKLFTLSYGVILGSVLLLVGCGGGGGGNKSSPTAVSSVAISSSVASSVMPSSVSVSSSVSSSSSSNSSVSLIATSSSSSITAISSMSSASSIAPSSSSSSAIARLTIQGKVSTDALVGGVVKVSIGGRPFTADVDDAKNYSLVLDVPDSELAKPVSVIATGIGNEKWVVLAALLPSVSQLTDLAGADKLLTSAEYSGVNITPLTTAQYAEVINSHLPITSDAERKSALLSMHPTKSLEQAAALSRLLTDISVDLPIQVATTLDYLLNADLADAYLEILRLTRKSQLDSEIETIQDDSAQSFVSAKKIIGNYFLEAKNSRYLLTFNSDGTGVLRAGTIHSEILANASITAKFTWQRKAKTILLNIIDQANYRVSSITAIVADDEVVYRCDDSATSNNTETCTLLLKSIQLDLIDETEARHFAQLHIDISATRDNGVRVYDGEIQSQPARLIKLDDAISIASSDIIGFEWFSENYSFVFSADGKVKRTELRTKNTSSLNWVLDKSRIQIDGLDLWITHQDSSGFGVVHNDADNVYRTALIKRHVIALQDSDWIGRWTSYRNDLPVTAYDVLADKSWRDGFENGSLGNWSRVNGHTQTAISNGVWRMLRDLLAVHDGVHYFSVCQGVEAETPVGCYLSRDTRAANFDSRVFWNNWSFPAFNEQSGSGIWTYLYDRAIFADTPGGTFNGRVYSKVSPTRLYNERTDMILEMNDASANTISLCEYAVNDACRNKDKRTYERGLEIGLTLTTGGSLVYTMDYRDLDANIGLSTSISRSVDKVFMVPKLRAQELSVLPSSGYQLGSINGCGGTLSGSIYRIPALTSNCQITASFIKK